VTFIETKKRTESRRPNSLCCGADAVPWLGEHLGPNTDRIGCPRNRAPEGKHPANGGRPRPAADSREAGLVAAALPILDLVIRGGTANAPAEEAEATRHVVLHVDRAAAPGQVERSDRVVTAKSRGPLPIRLFARPTMRRETFDCARCSAAFL